MLACVFEFSGDTEVKTPKSIACATTLPTSERPPSTKRRKPESRAMIVEACLRLERRSPAGRARGRRRCRQLDRHLELALDELDVAACGLRKRVAAGGAVDRLLPAGQRLLDRGGVVEVALVRGKVGVSVPSRSR